MTTKKEIEDNYSRSERVLLENPELQSCFRDLKRVKANKDEAESKYNQLRSNIYKYMQKLDINKLYCLEEEYEASISTRTGVRSKKVFDEEKFRKEHPGLYKKYQVREYHSRIPGYFAVRKIPKSVLSVLLELRRISVGGG